MSTGARRRAIGNAPPRSTDASFAPRPSRRAWSRPRTSPRTGKRGELKSGKTFAEAADRFLSEYEVITRGQRSPRMVQEYQCKLRVHLLPFFEKKWLSEITPALVQDYRIHRHEVDKGRYGPTPSRSTMHKDIVTLRQVLKCAVRNSWIDHLPDLTEPYRTGGKISHRAWFSEEEYKQLYRATRRRANKPPKPKWKWSCEQAHDYVLFMANTGLRPDEASWLEFRDVSMVKDDATRQTILEIKVRGKRGTGYCKSTTGAVAPFQRLRDRLRPDPEKIDETRRGLRKQLGSDRADPAKMRKPLPTDRLFPTQVRMIFNAVLNEENLQFDREGSPRTPYSLRHTYICLRLTEGADSTKSPKTARTSVEMIEKYCASHIASSLDAAAINPVRPRRRKTSPAPNDEAPE
jgi:integrase